MSRFHTIVITLILTALSGYSDLSAQSSFSLWENSAAGTAYPSRLRREVSFLCDTLCEGRASGSLGGVLASHWVEQQFRKGKLAGADGS